MNLTDDYIINLLRKEDENIFLVGGTVRDYLLGYSTVDKDIIVNNAEQFAKDFALKYDATFIVLDSENKIYRVVMPDKINYIDVTQPINNSLELDLGRRDFTINSIAINLNNMNMIDLYSGQSDIKNKLIRCISEENIIDDPLRILRGYRFASNLGFKIEQNTEDILKKYYNCINKCSVERINYELLKLFSGEYAHEVLLNAEELICTIYPIFNDVKKVPPNTHHHLGLYEHSVEVVKQIQKIYETSDDVIKKHLEKVDFGGFSRLAHLKFAGFLHDIGKFSTWTIEGDRHRFIKHDDVGSKIAKEILSHNKFSKNQIEYMSSMIKYHIYPSSVVSAENINEKIYMRYIRKMGNNTIDNIILAKADRLSARGPAITDKIISENINNLDKLLKYYIDIKDTLKPLPKLLSGVEIMKLKNINPSKELGLIIERLHEEQLSGNILTKEDAISFVKSL